MPTPMKKVEAVVEARAEERAAVVKWLRLHAIAAADEGLRAAKLLAKLADAIEEGEHVK